MIEEQEYVQRRQRVAKSLSQNSTAFVFSNTYKTRSNDTEFPFRQNSNFYYLSGFTEDNSVLVFVQKKNKTKTILFVEKKDKAKELWTGKRLGKIEAKKRFLVDKVYEYEEFDKKIKKYLEGIHTLYFDFKAKNKKIEPFLETLYAHKNIAKIVEKMRLIKSKEEINLIKKALFITKEAHHKAMFLSKKVNYEYELQAEIEYVFKKNAAFSDAYTSIVACANSANTLHYISNNKALVNGELILIDAGCEYNYYASDITRTIPVSGIFSESQAELYEMVLSVELEIIQMIRPKLKRSVLQKKSEELLCKGLVKLGILKGNYKKLLQKNAHKKYYPHGIGHWMGLDVHDEAPYKDKKAKEIPLQSGMVLTIEPAIYCSKNDKTIPKKFRGIGIRIEDNILVKKDGYENLSKGIVKIIKDIENLYSSL